ncbi:hypothetical protein Adt_20697 [Abeliophyllum distichum]|uniref:Uncharacterized protein n=1 Tax=Abeliophyllum distichum TaxID=126358 RepID=A0ABD1SXE8_9LAMI
MDVENSSTSVNSECHVRITHRNSKLDPSSLELLPSTLAIMVGSVYKYWTQSWEKVAKKTSKGDFLRLVEMNMIHWMVLTKEVYSTLESFDGKLDKEEANSKKLSEDLKAMSLEKAHLESDKRFLQVRLDLMVAKENDWKAKYVIELKALKECLKQARDQKRVVEASQKCAEEAQKLAEEKAFATKTAVATVNSNFKAVVVEKDKLLVEVKEEVERVKTDGREQLVKKIAETHLEWDISFLRHFSDDLSASEDHAVDRVLSSAEPQGIGEVQTSLSTLGEGQQCADPSEAAGQ